MITFPFLDRAATPAPPAADPSGRIRRVNVRARRLVDGAFAGVYHSVFKGRGMEFAEVREYVPGDDVRSIDWNVTARMGQAFVKQYVEERELTVMLLVDVSGSSGFGSHRYAKLDIAAELSATLGRSATANNDRVGLIAFSDRVERFLAPQKGRNRALRIVNELLLRDTFGRGTDLNVALDYLMDRIRRRTITFIISDFLTDGYETKLRLAHRSHEVIPLVVVDPHDQTLPRVGLIRIRDMESGEDVVIDTNDEVLRQAHNDQHAAATAARENLFRSMGLDSAIIRTDRAAHVPLVRLLRRRERRQSGAR